MLFQLNAPKVQKMTMLLERMQSTYYTAFRSLYDDVLAGTRTVMYLHICSIFGMYYFSVGCLWSKLRISVCTFMCTDWVNVFCSFG